MYVHISVGTLEGDYFVLDRVYRDFLVAVLGYETWVYLIVLYMMDFDVILVMA